MQTMNQINRRDDWHSRGYLPHFEQHGEAQFITFRLFDSLPASALTELHDKKKDGKHLKQSQLVETYELLLDSCLGRNWLSHEPIAELVQQALLWADNEKYMLHAWVIMPNHVHALITPFIGVRLSKIVHSWKSFTANRANEMLNLSGPFWQREYFDRYIRSERHFLKTIEYIENNPIKAGLCRRSEEWKFRSMTLIEN